MPAAAGLGRPDPLPGVELRGIEDLGVLGPFAPLAIGERVDAEVEKDGDFQVLPGELRGVGTGSRAAGGAAESVAESARLRMTLGRTSDRIGMAGFLWRAWGYESDKMDGVYSRLYRCSVEICQNATDLETDSSRDDAVRPAVGGPSSRRWPPTGLALRGL